MKETFYTDITSIIDEPKIIGREEEIDVIVTTLIQKQKSNVILIGQPGVGKSAIIEQLAFDISRHVHFSLQNYKIYALDIGKLLAGTGFRGKFEERLSEFMDHIESIGNVILFIDEIHNMIGAGKLEGSLDAANMLKEKLARGKIKCIGATTEKEYKQYIKKDPAFERRFGVVYVNEPSLDETLEILKFAKPSYEKHHNITIEDSTLQYIIDLTQEHMPQRYYPDKAISILDYACAYCNIQRDKKVYNDEIKSLILEKHKLKKDKENTTARYRKGTIERKIQKIERSLRKIYKDAYNYPLFLMRDTVLKSIEKITNMKIYTLDNIDMLVRKPFTTMYQQPFQNMRVHLIEQIVTPNKPIMFNLMLTHLEQFAIVDDFNHWLYHKNHPIIHFDMQLFQTKESLYNFIGPNPGFTGYTEFNSPFELLSSTPSCIVTFQNFEMTSPLVQQWIQKVIYDGHFVDNKNNRYSLKNTIILFTSHYSEVLLTNPRIRQVNF